jgi:hypothetical protein
MADIFVSYASVDRERVAPLVRRLEQRGFSVWWDRDIAHGQNYHRVIEDALDAAKCAIVVWSQQSVESEWVVNEASSARKRDVLVPVLLDAVEPPLEFRHLQTADLRADSPSAENEYEKLERSVQRIVSAARAAGSPGTADRALARTPVNTNAKAMWQAPIGWALGAGALLLGTAALLAVLHQLGWIGQAREAQLTPPAASVPAPLPGAEAEASQTPAAAPTQAARSGAGTKSAGAAQRINLLHPQHGAQIVAASEENWREILETEESACRIISGQSFFVAGLRHEQPTAINALAVHVDAESSYNLKSLGLFVADAERGPFRQVGEFEIPNYKNMRAPFHEFAFETTTARFVKLQVKAFQHGTGPNGNVCTMRLYGPD